MSEYFGSTLKAHVDAFDHLVEANDQALSHPAVTEALGDYATRLRDANAALIFPNIIDGRIEVPESKRDTNGFVLLPVFRSDEPARKDIKLGASLLTPTPQRRERLRGQLEDESDAVREELLTQAPRWVDLSADQIIDNANLFLYDRVFRDQTLADRKLAKAMTFTPTREIVRSVPAIYSSRPLIMVRGGAAVRSTGFIGHVMSHELTHGLDKEDTVTRADLKDAVSFEAHAYHVGNAIYEAHDGRGSRHDKRPFRKTTAAERARRRYADPSNPYTSTPRMTRAFHHAGILGN